MWTNRTICALKRLCSKHRSFPKEKCGYASKQQNGLGFAKLFSGEKDSAKLRLIFLARIRVWIPPAEKGLGNECGRNSFFILAGRAMEKYPINDKIIL